MAGLTRKTPKEPGEEAEDPLMNLAKEHETAEQLTAAFVAMLKLDQRTTTDLWHNAPSKQDGLKWLQTEFRRINNGRNQQVSLPKRIDVFVPMKLVEDALLDIEFSDTKGAEGTAVRPDIQSYLDNPRCLIVLCSRFAPDATMLDLLSHLNATGKADVILKRIVFLLLPRPDEAMAIDKDDGEPVDNVDEAYAVREAQLRAKLAKFPGGNKLPIRFYNAAEEEAAPVVKQLTEKIEALRADQVSKLEEVCAAIDDLVSTRQQEQAQVAFAKLRAGLREIASDYNQLPPRTVLASDRMLAGAKEPPSAHRLGFRPAKW